MSRVIFITRTVTGLLFLSQLVLGIVMWTGHGRSLMQVHMSLGALFVLAVWTLSAICARAGASRTAAFGVASVGVIVLLFGMAQARILPGSQHWVVQVLHLLLGFTAMAVAGRLTTMVPATARRAAGSREAHPEPVGRGA